MPGTQSALTARVVRAIGAVLQKNKMALFGFKDCPARDAQDLLSKYYFGHREVFFFEFHEPRFLWGGARFGAEVAASDF
jgi:hypothetical protein